MMIAVSSSIMHEFMQEELDKTEFATIGKNIGYREQISVVYEPLLCG